MASCMAAVERFGQIREIMTCNDSYGPRSALLSHSEKLNLPAQPTQTRAYPRASHCQPATGSLTAALAPLPDFEGSRSETPTTFCIKSNGVRVSNIQESTHC
jgi:hypothetical protein